MVTGNVFKPLIDLKKKLLAIPLVRQDALIERDQCSTGPALLKPFLVAIEECFRIVKWSSKFIEIKLFNIL